MQCWIEISRGALLHNFKTFCDLLEKKRVIPVLKSNAYGHGLKTVYSILQEAKPEWLAVTYMSEALKLRDLGYQEKILNVGPVTEEDLALAFKANVDLFVGDSKILESWARKDQKAKIHIKIDTGLSRRGFPHNKFEDLLPTLLLYKNEIKGIGSHYANVEDVSNTEFAHLQLNRLLEAIKLAKKAGLWPLLTHCSASASALLIKEPRLDLNRIGISTYGLWASEKTRLSYFASPNQAEIILKPVLSWKTKISSIREIQEGDYVGYGCTFKAMGKMRLGVLPVGYYEGYPRLAASHGSYVLVHGKRCNMIGRISMNMSIIDLGNAPKSAVGDTVTLIGRDGSEEINADQVAAWSETINYELVTRLNPQIPRLTVD